MKLRLAIAVLAAVFCLRAGTAPEMFRVTPKPGEQEVTVTAPAPGLYRFKVHSRSKLPAGVEHTAEFRWDDGAWRHRRLLHPNRTDAVYDIDRITFGAEPRRLRFRWNPEMTELAEFRFVPEKPVRVPEAARNYRPPFFPPARHPRLLVNPGALEKIRAGLADGVNREVWEQVRKTAVTPFRLEPSPEKELNYDPVLAAAISAKAFHHLVTGDRETGREAVELTLAYLDRVNFGNGQDICRKIGEIIYRASQVYDWCYALTTPAERARLREKMLFFAADMEIGWPPFRQSVAAGHGNEAQMSRDLLAMAIAVCDEDPEPYRYAMYAMLEVFRPAKEFLYRSGRHDQGSGYGAYRHMWDLFAELQFRRTFGRGLLPPEAAGVPYYWYYLRTPDNRFLIEGDASWSWTNRYFSNAQLLLTSLALWPDRELKEELRRNNPRLDFPEDPVFLLLVNDPGLKPEDRRSRLPLTVFYRAPLPGMAARTGWNFSRLADDVVVTMQGADYHYRNHQHLDMGSFQIYFRGNLAADLGQYRTYGLPFDWNFAKSSISHSVMLFRDPQQKSQQMGPQFTANSGGQEITGWQPAPSLEIQRQGDTFRNGDTLRAGWGPVADRPLYSFMETDLGILYPGRVKNYSRSFVFLNLGRQDTPAALLVLDRFEKAAARVEPIFQLTSIAAPSARNDMLEVAAAPYGRTGKLSVQTLLPENAIRRILTGKAAFTVGGQYFAPPVPAAPEANGSRTEITGPGEVFLHLIQIQDGAVAPLPVERSERNGRISTAVAGWLVDFGDARQADAGPVQWQVRHPGTRVLLLDLAPGIRELRRDGRTLGRAEIAPADGSFFAILEPGSYTLTPAPASSAPELKKTELPAPVTPPPPGSQVLVDGRVLPGVHTVPGRRKGKLLLPLAKLAPEGLADHGSTLRFRCRGHEVTLRAGDRELRLGALCVPLEQPLTAGEFLLPAPLAAGLLGMSLEVDSNTGTALLTRLDNPGNILIVDAGDDSHGLWQLLNSNTKEWAVYGRRIRAEILLLKPLELEEIAIKWARGTQRETSFRLEISPDGNQFHPVFDGASSGRSNGYEAVTFPGQKVQALRFLFRGSQVGPWNQLAGLRLGADDD